MDEWGVTPQEKVLDHLYEAAYDKGGFIHNLYGVTDDRPEAIMYIEDNEGNCWEITAKPHVHKENKWI